MATDEGTVSRAADVRSRKGIDPRHPACACLSCIGHLAADLDPLNLLNKPRCRSSIPISTASATPIRSSLFINGVWASKARRQADGRHPQAHLLRPHRLRVHALNDAEQRLAARGSKPDKRFLHPEGKRRFSSSSSKRKLREFCAVRFVGTKRFGSMRRSDIPRSSSIKRAPAR